MKHTVFALLVCFLSSLIVIGCSSSGSSNKVEIKHEFVREYQGLSKEQIFERSKTWIEKHLNGDNNRILVESDEVMAIIFIRSADSGKGLIEVGGDIAVANLPSGFANLRYYLTQRIANGTSMFTFLYYPLGSPSRSTNIFNTEKGEIAVHKEFGKLIAQISYGIEKGSDR